MVARNLHIVDVYDADHSGKQHKSFGLVLYDEGKSLVFYAYDPRRPQAVQGQRGVLRVGRQDRVKEVTHNLGILEKDDDGQDGGR